MTTSALSERMYLLLPAVLRLRDAESGGALRALIDVLAEQVEVLGEDLDQFYDDQFIETAATWVAPYIGDLIGYRPLHGGVPEVDSPRAEVANTIAYRRRKGTASVLEALARDVTGWPARVLEYFERVVTTQYMNHPRPHAQATVDLRNSEALGWITRMNGGFDDLAHTADVRRISATAPASRGRHNIASIGIALWRVEAVRVRRSPLVAVGDDRRFRFDPLGADAPLFAAPRTQTDITALATPLDVPLPLGRRWLADHLPAVYAARLSLLLETQDAGSDPAEVDIGRVRVCDLSDVSGGAWAHEPTGTDVSIDPVLGRVYLGTALATGTRLLGTFHRGVAVPVGAGTRTRVATEHPDPDVIVAPGAPLQPALDAVTAGGTVRIVDSESHGGAVTVRASTAAPGDPATAVHVVAAEDEMPHLSLPGPLRLDLDPDTGVILDGLLISGGPLVLDEVGDGRTRTITLRNCTLVPGQSRTTDGQPVHPDRASLIVLDPFAEVVLERCIVGPIVAVAGSTVTVRDCVIDASARTAVAFCGRAGAGLMSVTVVADQVVGDGTEPGGHLDLHETTVIGGIHATILDVSNSVLVARLAPGDPRLAAVLARRRQVGCVRFSAVPEGSRTATRYRCQPDPRDPIGVTTLAVPRFTSLRFGDPAYMQFDERTPAGIRRGADDESEMGATHLLFAPQREANLALRLDEYLRFGLDGGSFHAT